MSKSRKAKLPGFRDFLPEQLALRNHLFDAWRRVSRRYGFLEYDGPPLEPLELYTEKSGPEIVAQLYEFVDKGDRRVALRPEMTPSLARILGEHSRSMAKPVRWFSIPHLFRYERQQRGRLREHFQWNVDLVGEEGVEADAEVLAVALDGLRELGLGPGDVRARVSDRVLLSEILLARGVAEGKLGSAFAIIDKIERERTETLIERLSGPEVGLSPERAESILDLFRSRGVDAVEAAVGEAEGVSKRLERIRAFMDAMADLGLQEFVEFDLSIVRGLAYYTGLVFEIFDQGGELRAICGGGRYDQLLEWAGGEALPAVGFGMGDVVLSELLVERGLVPGHRREVDVFVVTVSETEVPIARRLGRAMRERGRSVVYPLRHQSLKKQFSAAAAAGAREVMILGPEEVSRGVAKVRDMATGEERETPLEHWGGVTALTSGGVSGGADA